MEKVHNYLKEKSRKTFGVAVIALIIFYVIWFIAWVSPDVPLFIVMVCFAIWIVAGFTCMLSLVDVVSVKLLQRAVERAGTEEVIEKLLLDDTRTATWEYCFALDKIPDGADYVYNAKVVKWRFMTFLYDFDISIKDGDDNVKNHNKVNK